MSGLATIRSRSKIQFEKGYNWDISDVDRAGESPATGLTDGSYQKASSIMNRVPRYLFLCLLFALACLPVRAQKAASVIEQSTSVQASNSSPQLTADGVPSCPEEFKSRSLPEGVHRVGDSVLPPIPTNTPEATFTDEARKFARGVMKTQHIKRFEAKSLVGLTVDTNGLPQNMCVLNEMGHGFDRRAFDAVGRYRFKPATLDDKPVPVRLTVEVTFALW
jgi:hypothetical protein